MACPSAGCDFSLLFGGWMELSISRFPSASIWGINICRAECLGGVVLSKGKGAKMMGWLEFELELELEMVEGIGEGGGSSSSFSMGKGMGSCWLLFAGEGWSWLREWGDGLWYSMGEGGWDGR